MVQFKLKVLISNTKNTPYIRYDPTLDGDLICLPKVNSLSLCVHVLVCGPVSVGLMWRLVSPSHSHILTPLSTHTSHSTPPPTHTCGMSAELHTEIVVIQPPRAMVTSVCPTELGYHSLWAAQHTHTPLASCHSWPLSLLATHSSRPLMAINAHNSILAAAN